MILIATNGDAAIAGLREQIMANAVILFPSIAAEFISNKNTSTKSNFKHYVQPSDAFNILVTKETALIPTTATSRDGDIPYCAVLAYQDQQQDRNKLAARGEAKGTASEALSSLLDVLAVEVLRSMDSADVWTGCGLFLDLGTDAAVDKSKVVK